MHANIWSYELCTRIGRTDYGREIFVTELSANGTVHPLLLQKIPLFVILKLTENWFKNCSIATTDLVKQVHSYEAT